jgi:two-component system cell cycle response regulator DivK
MAIDPKNATVLIVEDNADNLFIITDLLKEDVGVAYCNARATGRQLFKLLDSKPNFTVDLILLDIQIPYEDGYAILKQIQARESLNTTKVVAVTANVMPQDIARAHEAGFDGFIGKPIDADRFPQQIARILANESVWEPR